MDEDLEVDDEQALNALILALAAQVAVCSDGLVAPGVLQELADSHRSIVRKILARISHLLHYDGVEPVLGQLTALRDQLTETLRNTNTPGPGGELPGDVVSMAVDRPQDHLQAGDTVTIRYAGTNGTVDVEPSDDYVLATVPWADLERPAEA